MPENQLQLMMQVVVGRQQNYDSMWLTTVNINQLPPLQEQPTYNEHSISYTKTMITKKGYVM